MLTNDEWDLIPLDVILEHLSRRYRALLFIGSTESAPVPTLTANGKYNYRMSGNSFEVLGLAKFALADILRQMFRTDHELGS